MSGVQGVTAPSGPIPGMGKYQYETFDPYADPVEGNGNAAIAALASEDFDFDEAGATAYDQQLDELRKLTSEQFKPAEIANPNEHARKWIADKAGTLVETYNRRAVNQELPVIPGTLPTIIQRMLNDVVGFGVLEDVFKVAGVEDISINGPGEVCLKIGGHWVDAPPNVRFSTSQRAQNALNGYISHTNRKASPTTPIIDAQLKSGDRINIVTTPIASPWPVASIRKHRESKLALSDFVHLGGGEQGKPVPLPIPSYETMAGPNGVLTASAAKFLHMAVVAGMNILVIGATGSGKTTLMNALGRAIPMDRRMLVIEDTRELKMRDDIGGKPYNCVYFTTQHRNIEGLAEVTAADCVRAALRQRPDAIIVGESRGGEVFDLLKALWTGHRNGMTSIHADGTDEVADRIRMMMQEAALRTQISEDVIGLWIAKAFHLAVTIRTTSTGKRYIEEICEFTGVVEQRAVGRNKLFANNDANNLRLAKGALSKGLEEMLGKSGYSFREVHQFAEQLGELDQKVFGGMRR